jgi:hypothetical protein
MYQYFFPVLFQTATFEIQLLKYQLVVFSSTWRYKTFHFPVLFPRTFSNRNVWNTTFEKSVSYSEKTWKLWKKGCFITSCTRKTTNWYFKRCISNVLSWLKFEDPYILDGNRFWSLEKVLFCPQWLDNLHLFCQIQRKCLCFAEGRVWMGCIFLVLIVGFGFGIHRTPVRAAIKWTPVVRAVIVIITIVAVVKPTSKS